MKHQNILLAIGLVLSLTGCAQQKIVQEPASVHAPQQETAVVASPTPTVFKEPGIESEFTLPGGWTYKKVTNQSNADRLLPSGAGYGTTPSAGVEQVTFFDAVGKQVGGASFFATTSKVETSFDDCHRAWEIGQDSASGGNKAGTFFDHFLLVAPDNRTTIVAESCGSGVGQMMAFVYFVPGVQVANQAGFQQFYGKKPLRVISLHVDGMTNVGGLDLVHELVQGIVVK